MSAFNTYFNLRQSMNKPKEKKQASGDGLIRINNKISYDPKTKQAVFANQSFGGGTVEFNPNNGSVSVDAMRPVDAMNTRIDSIREKTEYVGPDGITRFNAPPFPHKSGLNPQPRPTPIVTPAIRPVAFSAPVQQPRTVPSGPGTHDVPMVESQAAPQTAKFDAAAHFEARDALSRKLHAAREARVGAAQRGEDFSVFKAAEDEYTRRLGLMNKIRNLEAAGQITPEQRLANAEALDAQVGPARLAAAESLGNEAAARMAAAGRFPQAQGRADEAVRAFADATGRINAPGPNFAGQVPEQNGRDFAGETLAARQRLQGMVSSPDVAALEERNFQTPEQVMQKRMELAASERQIRELNSDLNQTPPGMEGAWAFMTDSQKQRYIENTIGSGADTQAVAAAYENNIRRVESSPSLMVLASEGADIAAEFGANRGSTELATAMEMWLNRVESLPPQDRDAMRAAVQSQLANQGELSVADFRKTEKFNTKEQMLRDRGRGYAVTATTLGPIMDFFGAKQEFNHVSNKAANRFAQFVTTSGG